MHNEVDMSELYVATKKQRNYLSKLISRLQKVNKKLAQAEYEYKKAYATTVMKLHAFGFEGELEGKQYATDSIAWTAATSIARGLPGVAEKRKERDIMEGEKEAVMQKIYQTKLEINSNQKEMEAIRRADNG